MRPVKNLVLLSPMLIEKTYFFFQIFFICFYHRNSIIKNLFDQQSKQEDVERSAKY